MNQDEAQPIAKIQRKGEDAYLELSGDWRLRKNIPHFEDIQKEIIQSRPPASITLDCSKLGEWDSGLLLFMRKLESLCKTTSIKIHQNNLPSGVCQLLQMAGSSAEASAEERNPRTNILAQIGNATCRMIKDCREALQFIGQSVGGLGNVVLGHGCARKRDFAMIIEEAGPRALPIITLISFLTGMILAYIGALQLKEFGAEIYVSSMVGLALLREMGAIMVTMTLAGRTGAAYAAHIGSMKANEEIDALKTLGLSPIEFLVVPRLVALTLMAPLLVIFANFVGMVGGWFVTCSLMDVTTDQYIQITLEYVTLNDCLVGLIKSVFFGLIVAGAGCFRGLQASGSAASVGKAATSAVVTIITTVIIVNTMFAVIFDVIGI